MPNQLAQSKKRMTLAEQSAVLAALETIAKVDNLTVTDLLRHSARQFIAERAKDSGLARQLAIAVAEHAPKMPEVFRSPAKVAQFKREQREYDQLLQELRIARPEELQSRNSLVQAASNVRLASLA